MEALIVLKHIVVWTTLAAVMTVVVIATFKAIGQMVRKPGLGILAAVGLFAVTLSFAGFGWNATQSGVANIDTVVNRHAHTPPAEVMDQKSNGHARHHVH
jgi:EamA domain-containing membrane protein RarD